VIFDPIAEILGGGVKLTPPPQAEWVDLGPPSQIGLRQFSLKKLIEIGEVDWTKIYIKLNFNDLNRCIDLSYIDLVISSESYPFLKEEIPKNTDLCHNLLFCGKLKLRNKFCKNCMEIF